jgi:hypothetical protein
MCARRKWLLVLASVLESGSGTCDCLAETSDAAEETPPSEVYALRVPVFRFHAALISLR